MTDFTAKTKTEENEGEMHFRWYLEELTEKGFIKRIDRESETFIVSHDVKYKREIHHKTKKNKLQNFNLFQSVGYTYDFRIIWTEKALNIFTEVIQFNGFFKYGKPIFISHLIEIQGVVEIVSYIDVKPHYKAAQFGGKLSTFYTFPYIQKWLYIMKSVYINKVVPTHSGKHGRTTCLFATTFVPNRYLFHNKSPGLRSIPYRKVTCDSFVQLKTRIIEQLKKEEFLKNSQGTLL